MEDRAVYYANGMIEVEDIQTPHHLRVGGYPELLAEHCELVDRVAKLEARLAKLEEAHAPGVIVGKPPRDPYAIDMRAYVGP